MKEIDFSCRAELIEEMDRPDCDQSVLYATLRRFDLTNRLFTRYRALLKTHVLSYMMREPGKVYSFTDLGAGGCDVTRWLVRKCREKKLRISVRAIEKDARTVRYAKRANSGYPEIEVVEAEACDPDSWGAPDFVFAQHFLHHLPDAACARLLKAIDNAAPLRYVISDILRDRTAYHAFRLFARPFAFGTFIVEDGSISIRRGFTPVELRSIIGCAGLRFPVSVRLMHPSRFALIGGSADGLTFSRETAN